LTTFCCYVYRDCYWLRFTLRLFVSLTLIYVTVVVTVYVLPCWLLRCYVCWLLIPTDLRVICGLRLFVVAVRYVPVGRLRLLLVPVVVPDLLLLHVCYALVLVTHVWIPAVVVRSL